jgi:hypothetical protein
MSNARPHLLPRAAILLVVLAILGTSASTVHADRWKLADDGSCYFDANDSGPDQCAPTPGRYKLDSNGACYYDPNDTGANQCSMNLR